MFAIDVRIMFSSRQGVQRRLVKLQHGSILTNGIMIDELCLIPRGDVVSRVIPFFEKMGFDPEMIEIMSQAYEKARKSLHDKGQPLLVQEVIAWPDHLRSQVRRA